jgi:hypothetical protein
MDKDEYIKHYGVLGMRWGVRNEKGGSGKRPSVKSMSDKDLQAAVNRLNLEASYKRLTTSPAQKAATTVGKIAGGLVVGVASKYAMQAIKGAIDKRIKP